MSLIILNHLEEMRHAVFEFFKILREQVRE